VTTPLEALRVVDVTDIRGALCGRLLADFGADVIRVEGAEGPSPTTAPPSAHSYRQANKRSLRFVGPDALHDLLDRADVLVENVDGARRHELGLEPATVAARHPYLIHLAMADFGLSGPRSGWRLEPLTAQAAAGTLFASGFPDRPPCWFPGFLGHDCASIYGLIGVVAAIVDRRRHGRGQSIEVSVQEATLAGTVPWSVSIHDYLKINPFLPAEGKRNADGYYWVLPAADGWVRFVIGNEKQWLGMVSLARHPEALLGDEWREALFRRMNYDVARLVVADAFKDRTRAELFEEASRVGATLGVIHWPTEYVAHEQPRWRGVFIDGTLPGFEGAPMVRPPLQFAATPGRSTAEAVGAVGAVGVVGVVGAVGAVGSVGSVGVGAAAAEPWPPYEPQPAAGREGTGLLLDGVRVVEFGMAAVGPEVSLVLSELGADIIKVESRVHLDVLRQSGFDRINCGFAFNTECRGRRSVALNLDTEEGRSLAFELCQQADVVVENYRGGVLDGLGLGYEAVKGSNPDVVYASSQGYGRTGPLAGMPAYGPLNLGFVGLHLLWNHPDSPYPCGTSLNHPDHVAGKYLAAGVIAALDHRARTGEGQRLDLAQTEFAAYLRGEVYMDAWREGDPVVTGNDSALACPHGVFPALGDDRWVAIVAAGDEQWAALCGVAGWSLDPELATAAARVDRAAEIGERVASWTSGLDAVEVSERLQAAGVSACPVMGPLEQLDDPHLAARGFFAELEHPEVGYERHEGNPVRMSRTAQRTAASAPCLGAHTFEVLAEVLGRSEADVEKLIADGVCI
jgi:crotonobetainyl-CoA:carnitine CoA-transferase CaiB-like acyl-CoA transferase